jgi:YHS domain-containing protein
VVRGRYDSTDPDDLVKLADDSIRLASETAQEAARKPPEHIREQSGEDLFMSFGCQACHANSRVAPPLEGLVGADVMLDTRVSVKADDAYLRESIQDPMKSRVAGYVPTMPSYRNYLTEAQVDALIGYLHSIGAEKAPRQAPRVKSVDPVCHMAVSGGEDGPHAAFQGKTYYFCSDACQKRFDASPAAFADSAQDGGTR